MKTQRRPLTFEELDPVQQQAIREIEAWWRAGEYQMFVMTGHAGTGKTSVIYALLTRLERDRVPAIIGAPTGKAAFRLREKGVPASTIHKLAYEFQGGDDLGKLLFEFKGLDREDALVIIDEASMVGAKEFNDLIAQGYRILFVGDPGQLPPIGDDPGVLANPDFQLQDIHRHRGPLLDFVHEVRSGLYLPEPRESVVFEARCDEEAVTAALASADAVLCSKNETRRQLNVRLLEMKGLIEGDHEGDALWDQLRGKTFRVMGLSNYPKLDIYNGSEVDFTLRSHYDQTLVGEIPTGYGDFEEIRAHKFCFLKLPEEIGREVRGDRSRIMLDFGYALTAHKSQGSEWEHVVVYDDTAGRQPNQIRWCYTAATRAKSRLTWIHNGRVGHGPKKSMPVA